MVTSFGESHGRCVGVVIDGCPPGLILTKEDIQKELDKRKPISSRISTLRKEEDQVEVLSGIFKGHTTGAPICLLVWNRDLDSTPYEKTQWTPRPGHSDYPARIRYQGFNDYRGGGRFSGRMTVAYVMAGAVAKKLLEKHQIEILAHVVQIGDVKVEKPPTIQQIRNNVYTNPIRCAIQAVSLEMEQVIWDTKKEGDSVGGIVEGIAINVPPGIGQPIFDTLDSDLAKALFNIPAVKGIEFGVGFRAARLRGSQNNDAYALKDNKVITLTNNAGGILGGLSTGMPIVLRAVFKPTPSIAKSQKTVNMEKSINTEITIKGRHDACIVPRAVPVVESIIALTLVDHLRTKDML